MIAEKIFINAMSTAENMNTLDKEERKKIFKMAAELCFEMEEAFNEVYQERDNSDDYL